jgi:RNA polymerase sigma-70 factor, ECF subfamily
VDEQQAIVLLKNGNLDGLEELVKRYQLQAVRTACLITADRAQAEDIVQSAFIRAAERINQYDSRRPFGPWFLRSVAYDALKAVQRQSRVTSLDADDLSPALDLFDPAPLPEEQVEALELRRGVWAALQQLPPRQRTAIVLRYYLGLHEDEMAEELNGAAGTIKWLLHMGRTRLAVLLAAFHSPDYEAEPSPPEKNPPESGGQR